MSRYLCSIIIQRFKITTFLRKNEYGGNTCKITRRHSQFCKIGWISVSVSVSYIWELEDHWHLFFLKLWKHVNIKAVLMLRMESSKEYALKSGEQSSRCQHCSPSSSPSPYPHHPDQDPHVNEGGWRAGPLQVVFFYFESSRSKKSEYRVE